MLRTNVDTILILKTQNGDINVGVVSAVPAIGDEVEIDQASDPVQHVAARLWKYTPGAGTITCVCTVQR